MKESEAIALTEDAIFLAKRELYREMIRVDDESIKIIAENIVNTTIDNVLREIQQKEEEEDELEQLSRNFPYPDHYFDPSDNSDATNCLFSQLTDPFILDSLHAEPQRLDSIAEESETSEVSLRSSNSNADLGGKIAYSTSEKEKNEFFRNNSIVVHMDMEQQPEFDSSCDTGSFERNDTGSALDADAIFGEEPRKPVSNSPEKLDRLVNQFSLQSRTSSSPGWRSGSFDSAMSDTEVTGTGHQRMSLNDSENAPNQDFVSPAYRRPTSPTPPDSRASNHKRSMVWSRDHSRDWHTSEEDSAQASIGTSPLTLRRELQVG